MKRAVGPGGRQGRALTAGGELPEFTEQIEVFAEFTGGSELGPLAATWADDLADGIAFAAYPGDQPVTLLAQQSRMRRSSSAACIWR